MHPTLTKTQSDKLKSIQRRAVNIIFPFTVGMPYIFSLTFAKISTLHARRIEHLEKFLTIFVNQTAVYMTFFHDRVTQLLHLGFENPPNTPDHALEQTGTVQQ